MNASGVLVAYLSFTVWGFFVGGEYVLFEFLEHVLFLFFPFTFEIRHV